MKHWTKIGQETSKIALAFSLFCSFSFSMDVLTVFLPTEAAICRYSSKYVFLKVSQIAQKNTCVESVFNKVAGLKASNFIKQRIHRRCFPVKFSKIFDKTFNSKHLVATSVFIPVCPSKEDNKPCDVILICDFTALLN